MILIRYVRPEDSAAIVELIRPTAPEMNSPEHLKQMVKDKLEHALVSIQLSTAHHEKKFYALVMEDMDSGKLMGLATMSSAAGHDFAFYSYKVTHIKKFSHDLAIFKELELLFLSNDYENYSELYSFYLDPQYRKQDLGRMFVLARLLFIAENPECFDSMLIAQLRGITDEGHDSPFWRGLGLQFFGIPFQEAYSLTQLGKKQFISDLVPRHPIYTQLLPEFSRSAIAQTHPNDEVRRKILESEGFSFKNHINILDGGPILEAPISSLKSIKNSLAVRVENITALGEEPLHLVCSFADQLRAIRVPIKFHSPESISLSPEAAKLLEVEIGSPLRIVLFE